MRPRRVRLSAVHMSSAWLLEADKSKSSTPKDKGQVQISRNNWKPPENTDISSAAWIWKSIFEIRFKISAFDLFVEIRLKPRLDAPSVSARDATKLDEKAKESRDAKTQKVQRRSGPRLSDKSATKVSRVKKNALWVKLGVRHVRQAAANRSWLKEETVKAQINHDRKEFLVKEN